MVILAWIVTLLVAALHGYFLWLEMFKWEEPATRKIFGTDERFAADSKVLAANQGLYNGFLAAGLVLGLVLGAAGQVLLYFMLACVTVAGIYGGVTVAIRVAVVQALPAILALILWIMV
jgi:putative membrane protein